MIVITKTVSANSILESNKLYFDELREELSYEKMAIDFFFSFVLINLSSYFR